MNLFEKTVVFTDIHVGLKSNSKIHLDDCVDYIKWLIAEAKSRGAETCIFMGDFQHHRNTINALTLEYSIKILTMLNDAFDTTFFMVGNHDLFFRSSRDVTTMKFATLYPKIEFIDKPTLKHDVALIPWLVEDEWKAVSKIKSKYIFGHLELPGFKMNAMVEMPDHGELNAAHFTHQDYVFSGHFHQRQTKGKVNYIGNPFGHNYSDVWDFDRGCMFMEWGMEPVFINYAAGPKFINIPLSELLSDPDLYLTANTHLQVVLDVDITYEEATFLRETFIEQYSVREFKLIRSNSEEFSEDQSVEITMKTVDAIVIEQLANLDVNGSFDSAKLIEIYDRL